MFNDPQSPSIYFIIDCVMPDLGFIWIYSSLFHPSYFITEYHFLLRNLNLSFHKNRFYSRWVYSISKSKPSSIINRSYISKRQIYLTLQNNQKESGSACLIMKKVGYYIFLCNANLQKWIEKAVCRAKYFIKTIWKGEIKSYVYKWNLTLPELSAHLQVCNFMLKLLLNWAAVHKHCVTWHPL